MKHLTEESIFDVGADVLVNPVNCVGVMGGGLALAMAKRYPEHVPAYKRLCEKKILRPGDPALVHSGVRYFPGSILLFPTKDHWRDPSRIEWIEAGLRKVASFSPGLRRLKIAFPLLGCGLGGLSEDEVIPLMEAILGDEVNWTLHRK